MMFTTDKVEEVREDAKDDGDAAEVSHHGVHNSARSTKSGSKVMRCRE